MIFVITCGQDKKDDDSFDLTDDDKRELLDMSVGSQPSFSCFTSQVEQYFSRNSHSIGNAWVTFQLAILYRNIRNEEIVVASWYSPCNFCE